MLIRARQGRRIAIRPGFGLGRVGIGAGLRLGVHQLLRVLVRAGQCCRVAIGAGFRFGVHQLLRVLIRARQGLRIAIRPGLGLGRIGIFPGFRLSLDRAVCVVVRARQGCSIAGVAGLSLGRYLLIRMIDRLAEDACVLLSACLRFVGHRLVRVVRGRAENPVILVCPLLRLCAHLGVSVSLRRGQGRRVAVLDLAEIRCIGPRGSSGNVGDLSFGAGGADRHGVVAVVARPCAEGDAVACRRRGRLTDRDGSPASHRVPVANGSVALPCDVVARANDRSCPVRRIDLVRVPGHLAICVGYRVALAANDDIAVGDGVVVTDDLRRHSVI